MPPQQSLVWGNIEQQSHRLHIKARLQHLKSWTKLCPFDKKTKTKAFHRCFYPKWLSLHSRYTFNKLFLYLGIEPMTLLAPLYCLSDRKVSSESKNELVWHHYKPNLSKTACQCKRKSSLWLVNTDLPLVSGNYLIGRCALRLRFYDIRSHFYQQPLGYIINVILDDWCIILNLDICITWCRVYYDAWN